MPEFRGHLWGLPVAPPLLQPAALVKVTGVNFGRDVPGSPVPGASMIHSTYFPSEQKKGVRYRYPVFGGRPRGRSVDSRPSPDAVRFCLGADP
jgi:hypothetical protein